jgi:hypothetical protein
MSAGAPHESPNSIFPIPAEAILRPPQRAHEESSSASSSSSGKRKRGLDDASHVSQRPSPTRASSASDFSNTMKAKVRADYRNKCWHCSASPADVCHVIGSRDNTVSIKGHLVRTSTLLTTFIIVRDRCSRWTHRLIR